MDFKKKLSDMIDHLITSDDNQAQVAFHEYLANKTREFIKGKTEKNPSADTSNQ